MNLFEHELKMMFDDTDIIHDAKISGKTLLGKLDDDLRVKIQFITTRTTDHYDAVQASVINRTDGLVDKQTFHFADIIGTQKRQGLGDIDPHIWIYNGKAEWYFPVSAQEKVQIADTVLDYVSMYQDEGMSMNL